MRSSMRSSFWRFKISVDWWRGRRSHIVVVVAQSLSYFSTTMPRSLLGYYHHHFERSTVQYLFHQKFRTYCQIDGMQLSLVDCCRISCTLNPEVETCTVADANPSSVPLVIMIWIFRAELLFLTLNSNNVKTVYIL